MSARFLSWFDDRDVTTEYMRAIRMQPSTKQCSHITYNCNPTIFIYSDQNITNPWHAAEEENNSPHLLGKFHDHID